MDRFKQLLQEIRGCRVCAEQLPLGPRPVLRASRTARLLIIGQAPGTRVHATGIPWNDPSGDRLRDWLQLDRDRFYDESRIAIIPMGLCYPGKGSSGDLPPRPECAPLWHERLLQALPELRLRLLIGKYAQDYYLGTRRQSLAETVRHYRDYLPDYFPLPHPSPRNIRWFRNHPWFEAEVIPALREQLGLLQGQH
ncbi:MAG: uracil-DNA glycosylase family protein [Gammaproteobacteria bacterium]|nr:uracil-DNA glycosylase family protein [Gammaproteobacteria bacterium]